MDILNKSAIGNKWREHIWKNQFIWLEIPTEKSMPEELSGP